jgi:hypothetical protein
MQRPGDQPPAVLEKFEYFEWRSETDSLPRPKPGQRLWSGTAISYSPTLYTQALLAFRNSTHVLLVINLQQDPQ